MTRNEKPANTARYVYIGTDLDEDFGPYLAQGFKRLEHLLQRHSAFTDFLGQERKLRKRR